MRGEQKARALALYLFNDNRWKRFWLIYNYDVFLAQVKSFSMLRSCIINLCTFQHGHPRYLGPLQSSPCLNDTSCCYKPHFLDLENDKIRKKMEDFRLMSVKTTKKYQTSFPFLVLCSDIVYTYIN